MTTRVEGIPIGSRVVDSLPFSQGGTAAQAAALKARGVDGVALYLGVANAERLRYVLEAGMGAFAVTLGGAKHDGAASIRSLEKMGMVRGVSAFVDVEGPTAFATDPIVLAADIDAWCEAVDKAGWMPCIYVGVPQPLTSDELWKLKARRYWRGQGSVRDRNNQLAEPTRSGWCVTQMYPSVTCGGVLVDHNIVGQDYLKRVPNWAIGT